MGMLHTAYKYRPLGTPTDLNRVRQIVVDNELWHSAPFKLNDPFDCDVFVSDQGFLTAYFDRVFQREIEDNGTANSQGIQALQGKLNLPTSVFNRLKYTDPDLVQLRQAANEAIDAHLAVLSLSKTPTINLMWAHYGSGYSGIALGINIYIMDDDNDKSPTNGLVDAKPVNYEHSGDSWLPHQSQAESRELGTLFDILSRCLHQKAKHWEYEEELRSICEKDPQNPEEKSGKNILFRPGDLKEIVFGPRTDPKEQEEIISWFDEDSDHRPRFRKVKLVQWGELSIEDLP